MKHRAAGLAGSAALWNLVHARQSAPVGPTLLRHNSSPRGGVSNVFLVDESASTATAPFPPSSPGSAPPPVGAKTAPRTAAPAAAAHHLRQRLFDVAAAVPADDVASSDPDDDDDDPAAYDADDPATDDGDGDPPPPSWWIDWDYVRCVRDCVGRPPCGDRARDWWAAPHEEVGECCDALYGSSKRIRTGSCAEEPDPKTGSPTTASPTKEQTKSPIASSNSPTTAPTRKPTPSPGSPRLEYVGDDGSPGDAFPLAACQGDCDSDDDCQGSLLCYLRWNDETVPGCLGPDDHPEADSGTDYCCDRPDDYLFYVGNDGEPVDEFPLNACEGDCDSDDECAGSLVCEKRKGLAPVPGCEGEGKGGADYCRRPDDGTPGPSSTCSASPTGSPVEGTAAPTSSAAPSDGLPRLEYVGDGGVPVEAFPLGPCQGDCDSDSDCQGTLVCCQRWNNETVPGCAGEDFSKTDYCCDRRDGYLFYAGNDGDPSHAYPLDECEGDCDSDDECAGSLICEERSGLAEVPGCEGVGKDGSDYCRCPAPYEYRNVGTCESGEDKWRGPVPSADGSDLVLSFFVFGDTPYDDGCADCNTCIGEDGDKEEDCSRFDCILKDSTLPELPINNTCTYEGDEFHCVKNGIIPMVNSNISEGSAAFVAHVGDIIKGDNSGGGNRRCTNSSFSSRRELFSDASNFLVVPGDNDWNECEGYDISSNTDAVREMWRDYFAAETSPFNQFDEDFPGGGRPVIERQPTNPENFFFEHESAAFFGLNSVQGRSYVEDVAPEDRNAVWVERILETANCTIESVVVFAHTKPSGHVHAKLNDYYARCGASLPTLVVHGSDHPKTYCMAKSGPNNLTITVEAFQSSPLLVSIVHDPIEGGYYFHVYDPDPDDSNRNCPSLPRGPPTLKPTHAPNAFGATYVPGDLTVECDDGMLTLSKGMSCRLLTTERRPVRYSDGNFSTVAMHLKADGAGVIPHPTDGGWYYASNAEVGSGRGGVGTLRFDASGEVIGYERTLEKTSRNCGGGRTFWNTWISCEEDNNRGRCYEVDPHTGYTMQTKVVDQGGNYESFAYDDADPDVEARFFTTEDSSDGALVRYTPHPRAFATDNSYDILTTDNGSYDFLVLNTDDGTFSWSTNRADGEASARALFPNSEGIDVHNRTLNFVSKKRQSLFTLDLEAGTWISSSTVSGAFDLQPDQLGRMIGDGVLYFCEDGGSGSDIHGRDVMTGQYYTIVTGDGYDSETTGLAFSPDNMFMYVAFQEESNIYSFWRDDGLPFNGAVAYTKYHSTT